MGTPLRVLIVEDSEEDTLLIVRELKRGGFDPIHERVDTAEAMKAALSRKTWDLILADYSLPHFSGLEALKLSKESGLDLPFVIVSGSIGEDVAVEAMKSGAHDYLMKNNLTRLVPTIQQELREAEVRRKLKMSQNALQESEKKYRQVVENATEIIYALDEKGNFTYGNPAGLKVTGYSLAELRSFNYADLVLPEHRERVMEIYINQFRQRIPTTHVEFPFFSKAGKIIWFGQNASLVIEDGKVVGFHVIARDITEHKQAEEALRESEDKYRLLVENANEAIFVIQDGMLRFFNIKNIELIGYSKEELTSTPFINFVHPDDREATLRRHLKRIRGEELPGVNVFRVIDKAGNIKWAEVNSVLISWEGRPAILNFLNDITERKQAEEALRKSEQRFKELYDNAPVGYFEYDAQGHITSTNRTELEMLGYALEEMTGQPVWKFIVEKEEARQQILAKLAGTMPPTRGFERTYRRKDGTTFPALIEDRLLRDEKGSITGIRATIQDITDRKKAEEALRKGEERFRLAAESSSDLIYEWDIKERVDWFGKIDELLGYAPNEFPRTFEAWTNSVHPDDRDRVITAVKKHLEKNEPYGIEYRVRRKDGTYNYWWVRGTAVRDEKGNSYRWVGAVTDITDRKRAEDMLGASEERYRTLFEGAAEGILVADVESKQFKYGNPAICRMLGYTAEELTRLSLADIHPKGALDYVVAEFEAQARGEKTMSSGIPCLRKDGSVIYTSIATTPVVIDGRKCNVGFFMDITERKRAEETLRSSEEKYRTILENIEDGYYEVDIAGNFTFYNDSLCNILGYSRDEMIGMNNRQYTDQENAKKLFHAFNNVYRTGEPAREFDWEIIRKDGTKRSIEASVSVIKDPSDNRIGFRGIVRDITERKRAEEEKATLQEQLRQSQKIEAIGRLAGGIAHDFNNLLTVIKGYSQLSLAEIKGDTSLRENIEEIRKASDRAADLTRQLLAFSRRQILEVKVLDLNTVLRDMDKMLHRLIGEDIELITLLADDLGRVKTDPGWVEQIIMNLAVNARDAMPSVGKLTIETANVELDGAYARNHVAVKPGRYVMLSVSDTGVGMTPEVRQQVFDPFFTTKEKGKGTGLGLSTVYGIVKQSGGNIWVYSEPGKGTTFKIYLPCVEEPLEELKEKVAKEELPRGSETILLVEDEEAVRKLAVRILKGQGYTVLEGSDGNEAIDVCKQHKGPVHLLLTDVVMPGMSGRELAERFKPLYPKVKVLYMSGYTDNAITHHGVLEKGMNYLQKPFTVDGLARKVREVLDEDSNIDL